VALNEAKRFIFIFIFYAPQATSDYGRS